MDGSQWYGGAFLTERLPICASFAPSLFLCRQPYTAVISPWRLCGNTLVIAFMRFVQQLVTVLGPTSDLTHLPHRVVRRPRLNRRNATTAAANLSARRRCHDDGVNSVAWLFMSCFFKSNFYFH